MSYETSAASCKNLWRCLLLLAGLAAVSAGCSEKTPTVVDRIPAVKTQVVRSGPGAGTRTISGVIEAGVSAVLSFPAGGTVARVSVDIGDEVKAGQVLATLDPGPFDIALKTAAAQNESAQAGLMHAKEKFLRMETLFKRGIVAKAELDTARAALVNAESSLKLAQAQQEKARDDRRRTAIVAPFAGRVSTKEIKEFQEVAPGVPALTLVKSDGLKVRSMVPVSLARNLRPGEAVDVGIPSQPGVRIKARISEIGAVAEEGAAVPVLAALEGESTDAPEILVGSAAVIAFPVSAEDKRPVLLVPLSALAMNDIPRLASTGGTGGRAPLFVYDEDLGIVQLRLVEALELLGNMLVVSGGLSEGDEVVVAGTSFLEDGMRVRRWEPETPREEITFQGLGLGSAEK